MATKQQLESALIKADKAGDTAAAKVIATAINAGEYEPEKGFSAKRMVSNIPSSAVSYAKDIGSAVSNPIDTANSLGGLALGSMNLVADKIRSVLPESVVSGIDTANRVLERAGIKIPERGDSRVYPRAVGKLFSDRYGSFDKAMETLQNDPVGLLGDASAAFLGGGLLASKLPGIAGKAGHLAQQVGRVADPVNVAKAPIVGGIKAGISYMPTSFPRNLYESSAKFSTTFSPEKRAALSETALQNQILPNTSGINKLSGLLGDLDTRINTLIDDATSRGVRIPKDAIYRNLGELRRDLGGAKIEGSLDLAQIDSVAKTINQHLEKIGKKSLTPTELQKLKQDAYKRINYDAANLRSNIGKDQARKAIARAAKESIEKVAPVKDLNAQYGALLELKDPLQRSAARIDNRNLLSINAPLNVGAGSVAGGGIGAAAGTATSILENPMVKAKLALLLRRAQEGGVLNNPERAMLNAYIQQGLFQSGRLSD